MAAPIPRAFMARSIVRPILRGSPNQVRQPSKYTPANAGASYTPINRPVAFTGVTAGRTLRGVDEQLAALETDPPILEQAFRFDAPSLTIYIGTNKIAIIPALLSALVVRIIMASGSKATGFLGFGGSDAKPAKAHR